MLWRNADGSFYWTSPGHDDGIDPINLTDAQAIKYMRDNLQMPEKDVMKIMAQKLNLKGLVNPGPTLECLGA